MRLVCLNAWGGRVHGPLLSFIRDADPDVLCLQEVTRTPAPTPPWLTYRDGDLTLPQRADLFGDVCAALPGHRAGFYPSARGTLYDGDRAVPSEFGLATFVRSDLAVIGEALGFVHGAFSPDGFGPHPRARNAHCLRVFDYATGRPTTIAHMHGLRDVAGKHDTPERARQVDRLIAVIGQVWQPPERLVVCGDFNVLPGSVTFQRLGALDLADLVTSRGFTDTRTSLYSKPGRLADYMLVNGQVDVLRFDVLAEPEVSDHRALVVEIG